MTPARIEAATFLFLALRLNHCATAVSVVGSKIYEKGKVKERTGMT